MAEQQAPTPNELTFFRHGELILHFEPKPGSRAHRGGTRKVEPLPDLSEHLGAALDGDRIAIDRLGESLIVSRGGPPTILKRVFISTPNGDSNERQRAMVAVRRAVRRLNGGLGGPSAAFEVGDYRLVSASPNWLALPFI